MAPHEADRIQWLRDYLVASAQARLAEPQARPIAFTSDRDADLLLNDLENTPHALMVACMATRRNSGRRAFVLPGRLKQRLGRFDLPYLAALPQEAISRAMTVPDSLYWDPNSFAWSLSTAFRRIAGVYSGDAGRIWAGNPPSAAIVRRFLEFDGIGPKIATMTANILVRDFRVPVSDYYSIDISPDRHIQNVFERLGLVPPGAKRETVIYRARELWPEYPGIFDFTVWDIGQKFCHPNQPECGECPLQRYCHYHAGTAELSPTVSSPSSTIGA